MRFVLLVVNIHMHQDGTGAFPSQDLIAAETGLSVRTVRGRLALAIEQHWLYRSYLRKNKRGWNLYTYTAIVPAELAPFLPKGRGTLGGDRHGVPVDDRRRAGMGSRPAPGAATTGTLRHDDRHTVPTNSSSNTSNNTSECPLTRTTEMLCEIEGMKKIRAWLNRPDRPEHHSQPEVAIRVLPEALRFPGYEQIVWQILHEDACKEPEEAHPPANPSDGVESIGGPRGVRLGRARQKSVEGG
jgi:hypothetical protein